MHDVASFLDFLRLSPSSYHAAALVQQRFTTAGFAVQEPTAPWSVTPGGHVMVVGGAVIAWWVPPQASPESGFRIIASHTDSPGFKLKPRADLKAGDWHQAAVEVYGGPILSSWLDRELALAGRIMLDDGSVRLVHTSPILRIPHLAIHLDRSVNANLSLNPQQHLQPVFAVGQPNISIMDAVAEAAGITSDRIVSHDLITVDTQAPLIFGARKEFIAAGRLDNLSSVYPAMQAMLTASSTANIGSDILVFAAFDHEEVGSNSTTGAAGPLLEEALNRTAAALGASDEEKYQMLHRSSLISADAAHSIHPNYPQKHDPINYPVIGAGPVLKVNANQRYASDALSESTWVRACTAAGVAHQVFSSNNEVPCGSTVGPISATRLGISTVDVGIPLLSMHSARELVGVADVAFFEQALTAYLVN